MSVYTVNLTTLTPLHIGDGDELRQDFDFVVHDGRTYRLDEDAVLLAKEKQLAPDRQGRYPLPGRLLQEADYRDAGLFRYVLPGFPRSRKSDARMKSFIKDVRDRPYIPGSSLKAHNSLLFERTNHEPSKRDIRHLGAARDFRPKPVQRLHDPGLRCDVDHRHGLHPDPGQPPAQRERRGGAVAATLKRR